MTVIMKSSSFPIRDNARADTGCPGDQETPKLPKEVDKNVVSMCTNHVLRLST